jgi:hypothetical protein
MLEHFRKTKLIPWCLAAKRLGLPKDIRMFIMSKIEKNYEHHPVWEFIEANRNVVNSYCSVIYKQTPLYDYREDPDAVRKRPFKTRNGIVRYCYMHGKTTVNVLSEEDLHHWTIPESSPVIRLNH